MKANRIIALLLAMLVILLAGLPALAHDVPDLDRKCSITFIMQYKSKPVAGGSLVIYRVGEVAEDDGNYSFIPAGDFAQCGENFDQLEDPELAKRLRTYARDNKLEGFATEKINSKGEVTFTDLPVGLYLVAQYRSSPGYKAIVPFLVSLPYMEDGRYQYDLVGEPKTELEKRPTPPPPPPPPSVPEELPQTGQLWWPVPVLVCCGLVFIVIGSILERRARSDES